MTVLKNVGKVAAGVLAWPFVLAFGSMVLMPYILSRGAASSGERVGLILLGIFLGLLATPLFVAFGVIYTLFWLVMEILDWCGCPDCDCCTMAPPDYYQQNPQQDINEQNRRILRQLHSRNRQLALARINLLCDPKVMIFPAD